MRHAPSPRYEFKLRCQPYYLGQIFGWVRLHSSHWRETFPPRQVNNVYFDTYDHQSLNDNLGGVGTRQKLRLRWYGPDLNIVTDALLELKCREGSVGWKETYPLPIVADGTNLTLDLVHHSWSDLLKFLRTAADDRANVWLKHFAHPVMINHYQRAYYATPDQAVRLTVDSKLQAFDQRYSSRPNLYRPSPVGDSVIIELKADRDQYSRLVNLLDDFPIRISRSSKYVHGMVAAPDFDGVGPL